MDHLGLMKNDEILPNTDSGLVFALWDTASTNIHIPPDWTDVGTSLGAGSLNGSAALNASGDQTIHIQKDIDNSRWIVTVNETDVNISFTDLAADFFADDKAYLVIGGSTPGVFTMKAIDDNNATPPPVIPTLTPTTTYSALHSYWSPIGGDDISEAITVTKAADGIRLGISKYAGIANDGLVNPAAFAVEFTVNDFDQGAGQWFYLGLSGEKSLFPNSKNTIPSLYAAFWEDSNDFNVHCADGFTAVGTAFGAATLCSQFSMRPADGGVTWIGNKHRFEVQYVDGAWYATADGNTNQLNLDKTPQELFTDGKAYFVLGGVAAADITINALSLDGNAANISSSEITSSITTTTQSAVNNNVNTGSSTPGAFVLVAVAAVAILVLIRKRAVR